jgi:LPXTG-site transpeptidase (sortase) family protein
LRLDQNKISIGLISLGSVLIVSALTLMVLVLTGVIGSGTSGNSDLNTITTFGEPIKTATAGPSPTPPAQFPPGDNSPVERLIVDAARIDAAVVVKGVDAAGVMQTPDNAYDTAWYDFTARPGFGGNSVFSGHVDYIHVGEAVFWNLKDLNPGDLIQVRLADGTLYKYGVSSKLLYDSETAPVDEIVGRTPKETVTLITCGGTFNSATHQYDKRLVVRAERIVDGPALPPPA